MTTGDQFLTATEKRILGVQDFRERLIDYVRKLCRDIQDTTFGLDGAFDGPVVLSGFGANSIQLDNDSRWSDGGGHFLLTDAALAGRDVGLAFENTAAIDYDVALHYTERPRAVQVNPRTGFPEFVATEETIGNRADPTSVVNNGNGTMTFNVNGAVNPFGHTRTHAGRRVLVWKKTPGRTATTEATAMQLCTVAFSAGNNTVTTTTVGAGGAGTFGQTTPSVAAADYSVLLLGPTITRYAERNLEVEAEYAFVGRVTGNGATPSAFNLTGQNQLGSGFAVDLNAITRLDGHGDLKVRVIADALDADEPQIDVLTSGMASVFSVDEDGDTTIAGTLAVAGNTTLALLNLATLNVSGTATVGGTTNLNGNANIGNAEADTHTVKGTLQVVNDAATQVLSVNPDNGALTSGNSIEGGSNNITTLAEMLLSRFHARYGLDAGATEATMTQILDALWQGAGSRQGLRSYMGAGSGTQRKGALLTLNARRMATEMWLKDVDADPGMMLQLNTDIAADASALLSILGLPATPGDPDEVADAAFLELVKLGLTPSSASLSSAILSLYNGQIVFTKTDSVTNPVSTTPLKNAVCAKNTAKAWVVLNVDAGAASVDDGVNVAGLDDSGFSVSPGPSATTLPFKVILAQSIDGAVPAETAVFWSADWNDATSGLVKSARYVFNVHMTAANYFLVRCYDRDAALEVTTLSTLNGISMAFQVFGKQTSV